MPSWLARAMSRVEGRRGPLVLGFVTFVLFSCSVFVGLNLDDYIQRAVVLEAPGIEALIPRGSAMFTFATGDAAHNQQALDRGFLPWWSDPAIKLNFWRPLTELTHRLDYALWPDLPSLMHAHNLLWLALLTVAVASLYQRLHGLGAVAALAGLMFALDDAHNWAAAWLADRNGVIAALFGVLTLILHDRWRRLDRGGAALLSIALVLPGLLAGEAYVASYGYLIAYALVLDRGPLVRRLGALVPSAAIVVGWYVWYRSQGFGSSGSGIYRDPGLEPLSFLAALPERLSLLLGSQFLLGSSEFTELFGPREVVVSVLVNLAAFAAFSWLMAERIRNDAHARFWYVGMLISSLPFCAVIPMERNLLIPGIGAFGCLAVTLVHVYQQPTRTRWLVGTAVVLHLVLAPLMAPLKALALPSLTAFVEMCGETAEHIASPSQKHLVMLDAPDACASYATVMPIVKGGEVPRSARTLASGLNDQTITRLSADRLRIEVEHGWFYAGIERMFASGRRAYHTGDRVTLLDLTVEVTKLNDAGRPTAVEVTFDRGLDSGQYVLLRTYHGWQVPIGPLEVGESMVLPGKMVPIGRPAGVHPGGVR